MKQNIRGMKCSLDYYRLADFLKYLSEKEWAFYVPWCLLDGIITVRDYMVLKKDLAALDKHRIWELELQCLPQETVQVDIVDYQDFFSSSCACYLLYFDCGYLEIYVKQPNEFKQFWNHLAALEAEDLLIITDDNDTRTRFSV